MPFLKTCQFFYRSNRDIVHPFLAVLISTLTAILIHSILDVTWLGVGFCIGIALMVFGWLLLITVVDPSDVLAQRVITWTTFPSAGVIAYLLFRFGNKENRFDNQNDEIALIWMFSLMFSVISSGLIILLLHSIFYIANRWSLAALEASDSKTE
jgi:hypothetical protein